MEMEELRMRWQSSANGGTLKSDSCSLNKQNLKWPPIFAKCFVPSMTMSVSMLLIFHLQSIILVILFLLKMATRCCGEGAAIWLLPVATSTSTVCMAGSSDLPSAVWASQKHFCFGSWSLPTEQIFSNTTRPHASGRHRPPLVGSWDAWVWCSLEHQAHALEAAPSGVVHVAKSLVNFSAVEKVPPFVARFGFCRSPRQLPRSASLVAQTCQVQCGQAKSIFALAVGACPLSRFSSTRLDHMLPAGTDLR